MEDPDLPREPLFRKNRGRTKAEFKVINILKIRKIFFKNLFNNTHFSNIKKTLLNNIFQPRSKSDWDIPSSSDDESPMTAAAFPLLSRKIEVTFKKTALKLIFYTMLRLKLLNAFVNVLKNVFIKRYSILHNLTFLIRNNTIYKYVHKYRIVQSCLWKKPSLYLLYKYFMNINMNLIDNYVLGR